MERMLNIRCICGPLKLPWKQNFPADVQWLISFYGCCNPSKQNWHDSVMINEKTFRKVQWQEKVENKWEQAVGAGGGAGERGAYAPPRSQKGPPDGILKCLK